MQPHSQKVTYFPNSLGVWLHLVNSEDGVWSHALPPYIHQWEQSGSSANACHCSFMQNKIPDSPVVLSQSLIEWTIRAGMLAPPSPHLSPKMFPASQQRQVSLNQTRQALLFQGYFHSFALLCSLPDQDSSQNLCNAQNNVGFSGS